MSDPVDNNSLVSLQKDGLEEFFLYGHHQIRRVLQELLGSNAFISIYLFPGGLSFLSTIIALSEDDKQVFLDVSPDETIHRRCLQAEHLHCVTQLNKIRIQFQLSNCVEVSTGGHPALAAPVPKEILRLQRRDAFRLQVPVSHNLKCILPAQEHECGSGAARKKAIEVPVIDISVGGLSLEIPFSKTAPVVGDTINGCRLKLPGDLIVVDLEIRNQDRRTLNNGKEVLRLGCGFVSLPVQITNQIQRYIYQAERELRTHGA